MGDNFVKSVENEDGSDVDSCSSSKGQHKLDFSDRRERTNPFTMAKELGLNGQDQQSSSRYDNHCEETKHDLN